MGLRVAPPVEALAELKAITLALKVLPNDVKKDINKQTREALNPMWKTGVSANAGMSGIDHAVFGKGSRVKAGNPTKLIAGSSRKALSGGLIPNKEAAAFEFGSPQRHRYTTYKRRSPKGNVHSVTRRTMRQLPPPSRKGRIVYHTWGEIDQRVVSLYVQTVMRRVYEAFEQ